MNYKGHLTVGIMIFLLLYALMFVLHIRVSAIDTLIGILICMFGSLAPDLDIKSSKIHRWSYGGAVLAGIFAFFLIVKDAHFTTAIVISCIIAGALSLLVFFLSTLKHRGFTHHASGFIVFVLCMFLLLQLIASRLNSFNPVIVTIFFTSGYLSHILADL